MGSIEFVSAEPPQIALQGTGGTENSTVSFRVVGSTGAPIQNLEVDFSLNTGVGGLEILPVTATTDANGIASTVVSAGSVATSVRVTATERTSNISTQSSQLVVSTGIPDLDSFSIARTVIAVEGFNFDGITSTVTVRAADAFNNPVPDGTAISFYTEGGAIDASCSTIDSTGSCEVTWRSQNPRPTGDLFGGGDPRPGRVTVIAYAIGNESFQDQNGNGRYDDGESFTDIGEAFANENESMLAGESTYDIGEFFVDFDQNTVRNTADGLYTGVLCAEGATCSTQTTLTVFATATIVMSTSVPSADMLFEGGVLIPQGTQLDFARGQTRQFQVFISDSNGNPMPASTTVAAAITGSDYSIGGTTGVQIQDASEPAFFPGVMTIGAPDSSAAVEVLTLTLTTPEGVVSTLSWTLNTP
ncbi:MAG: Ig-like domain-containing protein [Pseudomonadota bacterium]